MDCIDRNGREVPEAQAQGRVLRLFYEHAIGRAMLKPLLNPAVSKAAKRVLSGRLSSAFVEPFVKRNGIDLTGFAPLPYPSFNAFFTRRIRPGFRPVDTCPDHLIAPCDARLTVHAITEGACFWIKDTRYTLADLVKSKALAERFAGGQLLLFRLTVNDYHRYCFVDGGVPGRERHIPGVLHTVNPIAGAHFPIYKENSRSFTLLKTENFGVALQMEVGALLVGEIDNDASKAYTHVRRGEEKGYFSFGGSTVIVCLAKNRAVIDADILENSKRGLETKLRMGEKIGHKKKGQQKREPET